MIKINSNISQVRKSLSTFKTDRISKSLIKALNNTAFESKKLWQQELPRRLHKPKPFTIRGWGVQKAQGKKHLARIYAYNKQEIYLRDLETGATKKAKAGKNLYSIAKNTPLTALGSVRRLYIKNNMGGAVFVGRVAKKGQRRSDGVLGVYKKGRRNTARPQLLATIKESVKYNKILNYKLFMEKTTGKLFISELENAVQREWERE